jgi:hypothetical protein
MVHHYWEETDGTINAVLREYAPKLFLQIGGHLKFTNLDGSEVVLQIRQDPQTLGGYDTNNLLQLRLFAWNYDTYVQPGTIEWLC